LVCWAFAVVPGVARTDVSIMNEAPSISRSRACVNREPGAASHRNLGNTDVIDRGSDRQTARGSTHGIANQLYARIQEEHVTLS
jgi:hypothetical protein